MSFKRYYDELVFDVNTRQLGTFTAKEGDTNSRGLYVTVINSDIAISDLSNLQMVFLFEKPDNTSGLIKAEQENGRFKVDYTNQVFTAPGIVKCELRLYGSLDEVISSKTFRINVDPNLIGEEVVSEDERILLDDAFALVEDVIPRIEILDIDLLETVANSEYDRLESEITRKANEVNRVSNESARKSEEHDRIAEETSRAKEEANRKNQESLRAEEESIRKTQETDRQNKESLRMTQEDDRVEKEIARELQEKDRLDNEHARVEQEDIRVSNEDVRDVQEDGRVSEESRRQTSEDKRKQEESIRATAETIRHTDETLREESESIRAMSESVRESQESDRITEENLRAESERVRKSQEDSRVASETDRESNETTRQQGEAQRIKGEDVRISNEEVRTTSESVRTAAEDERLTQENARRDEENIRKNREADRITQESSRQTEEMARSESELSRASSEDLRRDEELERKTAESTRSQSEADRTEAEEARELNESQRNDNESLREMYEGERVASEELRGTAESSRKISEITRTDQELAREDQESTRINQESVRVSSEDERLANEISRKTEESKRTANEKIRADKETLREENEAIRKSNESKRITKEDLRRSGETIRESNEIDRESNEEARSTNESSRVVNEKTRIKNMNIVKEWIANPSQFDGRDIEYVWQGTKLGVRLTGDNNYEYVDLKGDTGSIDGLSPTHIHNALGFTPVDYKAGSNIGIDKGVISVVGQLGLTEAEVKQVKVNTSVDSEKLGGKLPSHYATKDDKGTAGGYASLDSNVKIPLAQLPDTARQQTYVVQTVSERDGLKSLIKGEKCYVTSAGDSYIWDGAKWIVMAKADWENVNLQWANITSKPSSTPANIDSAVTQRHSHSNKSVIDSVTSALIGRWNDAWAHISDAVKHITAGERAKWNKVDDKADKIYVDDKVKTDVPANAKFTDTTYTAGENISISGRAISVVGPLGLTEAEVEKVKVDNAKDAVTVSGRHVNQNLRTTDTVQFGNVGIGTATPNESLDVVGNVRIREEGSLKLGGVGANDTKAEIVFNETTKSIDFNFF